MFNLENRSYKDIIGYIYVCNVVNPFDRIVH